MPRVGRDLDDWVAAELAPWRVALRALGPAGAAGGVLALNATYPWIQAYRVDGAAVTPIAKPETLLAGLPVEDAASARQRALVYARFLASVRAPGPVHIAVNLNDVPYEPAGIPVFSFQKERGSRAVLLPDIDLLQDKVCPSVLAVAGCEAVHPQDQHGHLRRFHHGRPDRRGRGPDAGPAPASRRRRLQGPSEHPFPAAQGRAVRGCGDRGRGQGAGGRGRAGRLEGAIPAPVHHLHGRQTVRTCSPRGGRPKEQFGPCSKYESSRLLYYFHGLQAGTHLRPGRRRCRYPRACCRTRRPGRSAMPPSPAPGGSSNHR